MMKRIVFFLLAFVMTTSMVVGGQARDYYGVVTEIVKRYEKKEEPTLWETLILAASESKQINAVYKKFEKEIKTKKGEYRLQTDYAKLVIVIRAMGKDPRDVAGYNLIEKLYNFGENKQGINGHIWALIALHNEKIPSGAKWTHSHLLEEVLSRQNKDGGFSLVKGGNSDVDLTAMAVSCLSLYDEIDDVSRCVDAAVDFLINAAEVEGGYAARGTVNCESSAQVIIALSSCGISMEDERFANIKDNPLEVLYRYQLNKQGFSHVVGGEVNDIATEQAVLAIIAYERSKAGLPGIYSVEQKVDK